MSLSVGIVGLPNAGKSTLFNALTRQQVLTANYPFATIDPNAGIVTVPDQRLDKLAQMFEPEKVTAATVEFTDIAGLVAGAHRGEGLGNKFLAHIRETSLICQVVRTFADPNVTHVDDKFDHLKDRETIQTEMILADLATVEGRIERLAPKAKTEPGLRQQLDVLARIRDHLDKGRLANEIDLKNELAKELNLLTVKPFMYVFNIDENDLEDKAKVQDLLASVAPSPALAISAQLESELAQLSEDETDALLKEYGLEHSGLVQLVQTAYETLGLITFFTAGPKEVRAWTIPAGTQAPAAAGAIHTDFERGFIAAEVASYDDLVATGSWNNAKSAGKVATCGRDYTMRDGDVAVFKFNV